LSVAAREICRLRALGHNLQLGKGYADGREARAGIAAWIAFYNTRRPHQALGNRPPMAVSNGVHFSQPNRSSSKIAIADHSKSGRLSMSFE
jgi:hypothetical protein